MPRVVFKYVLAYPQVSDELGHAVDLPPGSIPLHVDAQGSHLCLWALVDSENSAVDPLRILILSTGQPLPVQTGPWTHLSTFLVQGGQYVFHAFWCRP